MLWTEKRERNRIILTLPVEYYQTDSGPCLIGYPQRGYTVNASENGLMVISRDEIPMDSDLRIKLFFCFPDLRSVEIKSHVIWVSKREKDIDHLSGMKIVREVQEDLRKWEQFLGNLFTLKPF